MRFVSSKGREAFGNLAAILPLVTVGKIGAMVGLA
jgi:hypothetical protein